MGVSTRGVKFKFSQRERVLCYEPDPTKAKVLYESKVLDLRVAHDDKGRKVAEYLIHFCGWNSSWDRWVVEEFILRYSEENKELQTKLAHEADLTLQGKRRSKLIKEATKKQVVGSENSNSPRPESPQSSSDAESSEGEKEKEVTINIPDDLKKQLEEDWRNVTKKNKLVKLPCQPNVVAILEAFVKHLAAKLLCVSPPRNSKNGKQHMPDDVQNKLNLCKEAMDGLRVYFDFTLPHLLLYRQEQSQFDRDATTCSPVSDSGIDLLEKTPRGVSPEELSLKEDLSVNMDVTPDSPPLPKISKVEPPPLPISQGSPKMRPPLRNGRIPPSIVKSAKKKSLKFQNASNIQKPSRGRPRTSSRILRSIDKNKLFTEDPTINENTSLTSETKLPSSCSPDTVSKSPASVVPSSTLTVMEIRVTRKSAQQNMSPVSPPLQSSHSLLAEDSTIPSTSHLSNRMDIVFPSSSHLPDRVDHIIPSTSCGSTEELAIPSTSLDTLLQPCPPSISLTSNCVTSSNSSSHSTYSNSKMGQEYQLIKNADLLQEIRAWRLLPQCHYEQKPALPSLIYGAQHLLRLFVKLPELISKMNISRRKLPRLVSIFESFLTYMSDQKDILFVPSAYIDSCDDLHDGNQVPVK